MPFLWVRLRVVITVALISFDIINILIKIKYTIQKYKSLSCLYVGTIHWIFWCRKVDCKGKTERWNECKMLRQGKG